METELSPPPMSMKGLQEGLVQSDSSHATGSRALNACLVAITPPPAAAEPYPSLMPLKRLQDRLVMTNLSTTGPHTSFLRHYFPYTKYFLISPLPRVFVPESDSEDSGSDMEDTKSDLEDTKSNSEDSMSDTEDDVEETIPESSLLHNFSATLTPTGDVVMSTYLANPRFVVAKMNGRNIANDRPLLVVEVKLVTTMSESKWKAATGQLHEYMDTVRFPESDRHHKLTGLLICGPWVQVSRMGPDTGGRIVTDKVRHFINSAYVWNLFLEIAKENWD